MEGSSNSSPDDPDLGFDRRVNESAPGERSSSPVATAESSAALRKEKGRVRFNSNADLANPPVTSSLHISEPDSHALPTPRPRPSALRTNSSGSIVTTRDIGLDHDAEKEISAVAAQERALQMAARVRMDSPVPGSSGSIDSRSETATSDGDFFHNGVDIPLQDLGFDGSAQDGFHAIGSDGEQQYPMKQEAFGLVRAHTQRFVNGTRSSPLSNGKGKEPEEGGSQFIPSEINDGSYDGVYNVPPPEQYRGSVLSQLLKLYKPTESSHHYHQHRRNSSLGESFTPGSESGAATPTRRKWYEQNRSQDTLANLIEASTRLANPNQGSEQKSSGKKKPKHKRTGSSSRLSTYLQKEEVRITVHIAETLARQGYIIKLCRALMLFGAPTHRLEEYLSMTARVLEIEGQFLYLPGCMIVSFDDQSTHTTEVRIVRSAQGIDLGKLKDVHHVYKEVMHDVIGVEEGTRSLDEIMNAKDKFNAWFRVLIFGLTSATCAPFSFKARLIDLPLCFCFGCLVGLLQLIVTPKSNLYSNVFEVSATVLVSFLARAFGSIANGKLFCFSALAQSGIVMLLPGYSVLCSSLELQSRAIVPGSIRIVYAIIYSLLLGFGITVGATLYGLFDDNATSSATCENPLPSVYGFIFVPFFIMCISVLYQAKWRQMPVMVVIAFAGYIVNFFSGQRFAASPQIANTLGAFCVGVLANLYSRLRHGVAAATLIPAIFTQVPGGLASTGGLLSGLSTANQLTNSSHTVNGTSTIGYKEGDPLNNIVFNVAASMIQIAIGIAVGLFISALVVYPLGKRRSGLFSF